MPHTHSARKRLRQDAKRRLRNRSVKTHLKTRLKRFDAAVAAGSPEEARKQARLVQKFFDRAVTRGVIHRNRASRKKASVFGALNHMLQQSDG